MEDVVEVSKMLGFDLIEWEQPRGAETTHQGRVFLARTTEGRAVVVKWSTKLDWGQHLPDVARSVEVLINRGYPCPSILAYGPVGKFGYGMVQQQLPGKSCIDGLTWPLMEQVLNAIELQANDFDVMGTGDWSWVTASFMTAKQIGGTKLDR